MRRTWQLFVVAVACLGVMAVPSGAQTEPTFTLTLSGREEPPKFLVSVSANIAGGTRVRVTIAPEGGATRELFSSRVGDSWSRLLPAEPCDLGGSDLPGAKFTTRIEATDDSLDAEVVLSPDRTKPRFLEPTFDSSPQPGDRVEAGEEIGFEVTATDKTPARTWQTGVHTLTVTGPRGEVKSESGGRRPKACEDKSKSLTVQSSYRVRESDPAVIELCAVAQDYVPNENKKCAKWYKGEVWEGTISGGDAVGSIDICGSTWEGTMTLAVAKDDRVSGTAQWIYTSHTGPGVQCNMPIGDAGPLPVVGSATRGAFELFLPFSSVAPVRIPKSGTRAQREWSGPHGEVHSVELRCVSC